MPRARPDPLEGQQLYAGAATAAERTARAQLLRYCHAQGASVEQLRQAVREDRLATLPLEFALTSSRCYTLTALSRESGVPAPYLRAMLLALGHPNPRPRERSFTQEDLQAAQALAVFLKAGLCLGMSCWRSQASSDSRWHRRRPRFACSSATSPRIILADEATREQAKRHLEWTRTRRRRLKGIGGRSPIYRLVTP